MKLYLVAIHDKVSDNLFAFVNSTSIESGAAFIVKAFTGLSEKIPSGDYEVVSIGFLDVQKKEFTNDYQVVSQLGLIDESEVVLDDDEI